jgi:hypothetical protein
MDNNMMTIQLTVTEELHANQLGKWGAEQMFCNF